ncbi:hypothetical protein KCP71_09210 [Salmonella enterica subsp. enterica]|nr:hypothetical protein KCP71_09210 [Salmonella enterica subsp. enterica]
MQDKLNARLPMRALRRPVTASRILCASANAAYEYPYVGGHNAAGNYRIRCQHGIYAPNFGGGQVDITSASLCSHPRKRI